MASAQRDPKKPGRYPLGKKVDQWKVEHDLEVADFVALMGFNYGTFYGWAYRGRPIPAWAVKQIAKKTGLTMEYWTNDSVPYPPPAKWLEAQERIWEQMGNLTDAELEDLEAMMSSPEDLRRTLALRRAARG